MKNVLIISYRFNQTDNIGSVRLRGLAKYLPEFGWTPIILSTNSATKSENTRTIIELKESDFWKRMNHIFPLKQDQIIQNVKKTQSSRKRSIFFKYLLKIWEEIFTYPAFSLTWTKDAVDSGRTIIMNEPIHVIISSSSPASAHLIAQRLKKQTNVPWIADFRDPWTQNHNYHRSYVRKKIEHNLEIRTIVIADTIVSVSEHFCEKLSQLHKNKKISLIYNGYDPDDKRNNETLSEKFSITYTGNIYTGFQDPGPLFTALNELINERKINARDIEINFYGKIPEKGFRGILGTALEGLIKFNGRVSRDLALQSQRNSQILLLLSWNDPNEKGVIPAKIFEYLAAKRPILSIGRIGGGEVQTILNRTNAGFDLTDIVKIKEQILLAYSKFKTDGSVPYDGISEEIERFSQREMARKYAEILDGLIEK